MDCWKKTQEMDRLRAEKGKAGEKGGKGFGGKSDGGWGKGGKGDAGKGGGWNNQWYKGGGAGWGKGKVKDKV